MSDITIPFLKLVSKTDEEFESNLSYYRKVEEDKALKRSLEFDLKAKSFRELKEMEKELRIMKVRREKEQKTMTFQDKFSSVHRPEVPRTDLDAFLTARMRTFGY